MTASVREALEDGSWGRYHGRWGRKLETQLAELHQVEHVCLTCSGTAAVELALRGLGVAAGDEVILSAYDFKGNFQDVLALGAIPVLVDVRPEDWALDVGKVAAAFGPKSKAIIASHLHGALVDMPALCKTAADRSLGVLEDACQSPGAMVCGRPAGTWGDVGVLSFGGSKLVTAGRGGAVVTNRADVAQRIRLHVLRGNDAYPLSELQAAALVPQWERLPEWNCRRALAVNRLRFLLWQEEDDATREVNSAAPSRVCGLTPFGALLPNSLPAYYKWGLRYCAERFGGLTRDQFAASVRAEGIALDPGLRGLHRIHSTRRFRAADDLNEATRADGQVLTLHHPVLLGDDSDLLEVSAAIQKIRQQADQIVEWFASGGCAAASDDPDAA